jgi:hypothetical protein
MNLEKVAAAAFLDELKNIAQDLGPDLREKLASSFYDHLIGDIDVDQLADFMKQAGILDSLKGFVRGGNQNGIPMMGLGQQLAASNPFHGMGSSLASGARAAGGAISNAASRAGGAIKNVVSGGTNAQGIPMKGLGQMAAESNPLQGMGSSLSQGASALAGGVRNAASKAWNGGPNAQGIPMMGMKQQMAASNPMEGMGASLAQGARDLGRPAPSFGGGGGAPMAAPPVARGGAPATLMGTGPARPGMMGMPTTGY